MSRPTTIKDIARILKISVSTVSRALRDAYDVNEETRNRVLAAAAEINYKPNYNATALAKRSTHNIGVILPFITNYYFSTVITGIQEVAYSKGFNIILHVTNDSPERELSIVDNLSLSSFDGLLVSTCSQSDSCEHFARVIREDIPVVFFDRVPNQIRTSKVMQDDFNGAFEAVEHLVSNGYRRVAHIAGPRGLLFTEKRYEGYLAALTKHNLPVVEDYTIYSGFSQESGQADTIQLMDLPEPPDAIFAVNDRKAIGAMLTLKARGIRIGKEVGVIGFTDDPMASIISPSLSTIAEPAFEIGRKSCELLLGHIRKKSFIPEEKILPGKLIVRESTNKG
ncbi:LacI family transcriptional regulator [Terrimonas sp. NA20]|uniref:LacI family transcriptional regulator n=1 Tax=Terrimonas ginsenosidimutans TaxID=2908004 RepID=A0ABS9KT09_9BACT|nr:LacI family DNA-binding transcriptional regulator [Terrimonas ginsenosidimutans]MCG2615464.1 LacI family transcriptional regulator [Terrimonas ginsenosidimutans]